MTEPYDRGGAVDPYEVDPYETEQPSLSLGFRADPLAVRAALMQVKTWLGSEGVGQDDLGNVEIVLAEALNNIAEHSYRQGTAGPVTISVKRTRDELCIMLTDNGRAIPEITLSGRGPGHDCPEPELLNEGGFGWYLIRCLTRDVVYFRKNSTNHLQLRLALECRLAER